MTVIMGPYEVRGKPETELQNVRGGEILQMKERTNGIIMKL